MELRFVVYLDAAGRGWRWRLLSAGGAAIARSGQAYATREGCIKAIELLSWSSNVPVLFVDAIEAESPA